jgi:hypothetical protein
MKEPGRDRGWARPRISPAEKSGSSGVSHGKGVADATEAGMNPNGLRVQEHVVEKSRIPNENFIDAK